MKNEPEFMIIEDGDEIILTIRAERKSFVARKPFMTGISECSGEINVGEFVIGFKGSPEDYEEICNQHGILIK